MQDGVDNELEALLQFLYQSPVGLVQTDAEGDITLINPMAAQLLMPLAPDGQLGNLLDVLDPVAPQLRPLLHDNGGAPGPVCEALRIHLPLPNGHTNGHATRAQPSTTTLELRLVRLAADKLMASLSDVSLLEQAEQRRLEDRLRDAARIDTLTSLPNRSVALERIEAALHAARQPDGAAFAVLFVNGDRFNRINVTMGQAGGDELLRQMAARLMGMVRLGDAVARTGDGKHTPVRLSGDEFVVVMEDLRHPADASGLAARVVEVLGKPYRIGNEPVFASVSVGVTLGHGQQPNGDAVLQEASLAMREAKLAGGARHKVFTAEMRERAWWRGVVEDDLRQAVQAGQLYVVYQPIVRLGSMEAAGMEALVRWNHPVRGLVSPADFIPIAEESGLIGPVSAFVLRAACTCFVQWRQTLGHQAPGLMSVNLSRAQLSNPTLPDEVAEVLRGAGMPPACLQLEVTESLAAQDESVQARLRELKGLGLTLALDDFGTGYSSLASLHQLPVDVVKIDRSFVSQLESSEYHRVLVQATVRVARTLGMRTVAEGVETPGQAQLLQALQCDKGQGYLYGRPLTEAQATDWLRQQARPTAPAAPMPAAPPASGLPSPFACTRLQELLDHSQLAVAVFDPQERLAYANQSYRSLYWDRPEGTPTWEEVMREAYRSRKGLLIDTADIDGWLTDVRKRYRQQPLRRFESDIADGRWLRVTEETRPDGWQLCVSTDVTSLKSTEADLRRARDAAMLAAITDPLTELPNRRFVFERLQSLLALAQTSNRPLTVVLIDLDEFKAINDQHGHAVGDQVLVGFSQRLAQSVRQRDAVGRIGGEEFLLVLTDTGHEGALRVVNELRSLFAADTLPHLPPGVHIGFSTGIAQADANDTADTLWQRADRGLYRAKDSGRGRDVFVPPTPPT
ncbi:diguanylate cyclase domain-containing protein [Hydrogenophaga defluvii]|uniref:Diguanylate cyclase domain-containing protein n=1 Tax=Hydrogenophaga defluvii TaxID=249410 RepID=A0ABW2SIB5_9BURK